MKLVFIFTIAVIAAIAAESQVVLHNEWNEFKVKYNKVYNCDNDEQNHMKIFLEKKRQIDENNILFKAGKVSYKLGVNTFSDLSEKEMRKFKGFNRGEIKTSSIVRVYRPSFLKLPRTVDWRDRGAVTPVKHQGACNSCWAFTAIGSLEGQHYLKTGKLVSLSEQNLIDCVTYARGCFGGSVSAAFEYINYNGGINTEESYPYEIKRGKCRYRPLFNSGTIFGYTDLPRGDEFALQDAVATIGPIAVAIDANRPFESYISGIYNNPHCSTINVTHGVVIVGYGTENGNDYWLAKNSWGSDWGDKGYIKLARNKNNQCAIATYAVFPNVFK